MKILIICSGNFTSEKSDLSINHAFIYDQIEALKKLGGEFDVFYIKGKGILGYLKNISDLKSKLKKNNYDLIHAHYGYSGLLASFVFTKPILITFHGTDINNWKSNLITSYARFRARGIIFVSDKLKKKAFLNYKNKGYVIPCGIDLEIFKPIQKTIAREKLKLDLNKKIILFSSSFSNPIKNYPLAKEAVEKLQIENNFIEIKNRTREEVCLLLNAADVLLLTSFSEGSPQIIKEAMACNCPIVSTDVGVVKEIIDKTNGCYISLNNSKDVHENLLKALNYPTRTNGREGVLHLDNKLIAAQVFEVYKRSLNQQTFDEKINVSSINGIKGQICSKGVWDESVPGINFDKEGISNYAHIFYKLLQDFPKDETGQKKWTEFVKSIKAQGKDKPYDCIIGVSGGTDSCYLLHKSIEWGLKPLAVFLDNGWASNTSLSNIKKLTDPLNIDLITHVINYEEVKDVLKSYLKAGLPWADSPTDLAIKAILYKTANKFNLKHILIGHDFSSEGFQPTEWTYSDDRQMRFVAKKFSDRTLKTFPNLTLPSFLYYSFFKGIKYVKPFFYIPYSKQNAKTLLKERYSWEDYGGHHYENIYTKFIISYWLYKKFGIDKRKITFSAQILSGEMKREDAILELSRMPYDSNTIEADIGYILKKLDLTNEEFNTILLEKNKYFFDYPSYYPIYKRFKKIIFYIVKYFLPNKPLMFYQIESRNKNN